MEHKHKLLATASCQPLGACTDSRIDRLSTLSDELAHHILSFLDFRDLTQVGCVSTRCREFYLSTPSLNLEVRHYEDYKGQWKRSMFLNSFDRFLIQRGDKKIQSFRIRWVRDYVGLGYTKNCLIEQNYRLITWIHNAVRCNVEVLYLEFYTDGEAIDTYDKDSYLDDDDDREFDTYNKRISTLTLPSCIFLCQSLRYLKVVLTAGNILKAPSFACCTNLQCLKLKDVTIDEGFCKSISGSCKFMKELWLVLVSGITNMSIQSSSLESFTFVSLGYDCHLNISCEKLEHLYIDWECMSHGSDLLNIFAPNLKYLFWSGDIRMNYRDFENFMCLEKAEIHLYPCYIYDYDKVFKLLCSMPRVKSLILNRVTVKALFKAGCMPTPLDDIWYFRLDIGGLKDGLVPPMVHLLRGMPNLNTLYVTSAHPDDCDPPPNVCQFDGNYWKSQNLAFIHQLKNVTIELSNKAVHNELELALYLLEHAEHLKKMVILYSLPQSVAIFSVLSRMSSIGKVVFLQR